MTYRPGTTLGLPQFPAARRRRRRTVAGCGVAGQIEMTRVYPGAKVQPALSRWRMLTEFLARCGQAVLRGVPPAGRGYWLTRFWDRAAAQSHPVPADRLLRQKATIASYLRQYGDQARRALEFVRGPCGRLAIVLGRSVVAYGESHFFCALDGRVSPEQRAVADLEAGRVEPPSGGMRRTTARTASRPGRRARSATWPRCPGGGHRRHELRGAHGSASTRACGKLLWLRRA